MQAVRSSDDDLLPQLSVKLVQPTSGARMPVVNNLLLNNTTTFSSLLRERELNLSSQLYTLKEVSSMAEKPPTKANFPIPPPFYKHFIKDKIAQLHQIQKEKTESQATDNIGDSISAKPEEIDPTGLPADLRYLVPPPPPADGKWRTFGAQHDLHAPDPSLEDAGIEVLFPSDPSVKLNPQPYLLSLARSLLTTFLALTGALSEDPTEYLERVTDLKTIVTNMHDLINQYRPHQARETLILMLEERIEKLRGEVRAIGEAGEKMEGTFKQLRETGEAQAEALANGHEIVAKYADKGMGDHEKQRQKAAWDALQAASLDDDEET
jgi:mediator of RNA polymerase II transcription subunit 7